MFVGASSLASGKRCNSFLEAFMNEVRNSIIRLDDATVYGRNN